MERCLMATSIAVLLCHPNSTIKCFNPKPRSNKPTPPPLPPQPPPHASKPPPPPATPTTNRCRLTRRINSSSYTRKRIVSPQSKARRHREANLFLELTPRGELAFGAVESTLQKHGCDPCTKLDIDRVLRVNHKDDQVLDRFEKYRSDVMDKASGSKNTIGGGLVSERVFADGNEILCFRGASLICGLGSDGRDTICDRRSCGVCRLMRIVEEGSTCGSSHEKDNLWPMLLSLNSWRAHKKAAKKCCGNGGCGGGGRKAIVICRVIAGCVGNFVKKENNIMECEGFDSALLSIGGDNNNCSDQDLLVLNPTAVLPCFVVVYNASS